MPRLALLAASLCALQPQVHVGVPDPTVPQGAAAQYGEPAQQELASIAFSPERYTNQRAHVITKGQLDLLEPPERFVLREAGARVLLILGHGMDGQDLLRLAGRVEIRGIVRSLRPKEYVHGVDVDLIEDPALPVLPEPRSELPRVSITVLGFADANEPGARERAEGDVTIGQIVADAGRYSGTKTRLVGRFRGRNLYTDLPKGSEQGPSDWVLLDGESAVWVCGKPPRGKGWSLDPGYKGDTNRWLEVHGRIEVVGGIVYVRASKVALAKGPAQGDQDTTP
jgi:hypothetical protein